MISLSRNILYIIDEYLSLLIVFLCVYVCVRLAVKKKMASRSCLKRENSLKLANKQ